LSECDQEQYIDMCEPIFRHQNQEITYDEFLTHAAYKLMKMKPSKKSVQTIKQRMILKPEEKICLWFAKLVKDFFEEDRGVKTIKARVHPQSGAKIYTVSETFYGPSDNFYEYDLWEYIDGLRLFHDFHATGDYSNYWLRYFIAQKVSCWNKD
jgi:hypothetical protein